MPRPGVPPPTVPWRTRTPEPRDPGPGTLAVVTRPEASAGEPDPTAHRGPGDRGSLVVGAVAAGRVALGVTALAVPDLLLTGLLGPDQGGRRRPALRMFARMLGVRDLALGMATLASLDDPPTRRRLVALSAAADAVDGLVTIRQTAVGRRTRRLVAASAFVAAAAGAWQARQPQSERRDRSPGAPCRRLGPGAGGSLRA